MHQQLDSIGDHLQDYQGTPQGSDDHNRGNMIHIEGEGDIYDDVNNESSKNVSPDNDM